MYEYGTHGVIFKLRILYGIIYVCCAWTTRVLLCITYTSRRQFYYFFKNKKIITYARRCQLVYRSIINSTFKSVTLIPVVFDRFFSLVVTHFFFCYTFFATHVCYVCREIKNKKKDAKIALCHFKNIVITDNPTNIYFCRMYLMV